MISHKSADEKAAIRVTKNLKRTLSQLKASKEKKEAFQVKLIYTYLATPSNHFPLQDRVTICAAVIDDEVPMSGTQHILGETRYTIKFK